jgi:hypothetical protein
MWTLGRPKRRDLLLLSTLAMLLLTGSPSVAKAAEKVYRVGVLAPEGMHAIQSFKERCTNSGGSREKISVSIIARRKATTRASPRWRPNWWGFRST